MQCHDLLNLWGDDDPMLSIQGDPYPQQVPFPPNGDAHSDDRLDSINMNGVFDVEDLLNDMLDADSTLVPTITVTVAPLDMPREEQQAHDKVERWLNQSTECKDTSLNAPSPNGMGAFEGAPKQTEWGHCTASVIVSAPGLIIFERFTQEHVNTCFDFEVRKRTFQKLKDVHHLWHHFYDFGIAHFRFDGPLNVWGFHSVHVVDREQWGARVLACASGMARNVSRGGKPATRPVQSIYEIIQYCGMTVVRGKSKSKQPRLDKKALEQDEYFFSEHAFSTKKHRAKR